LNFNNYNLVRSIK